MKYKKQILAGLIVICLLGVYAWWNGLKTAYAYETSVSTTSRTYAKGYFDVIIKGPSGQEWINGEVNYSGSQITQDKFNNTARTITLNRKSGEASGVYKAKITTTSTKTIQNNSQGNYTRFEFNVQYTQPAHEVYSSSSADTVSELGSSYTKASSNFSSQSGHSTSARTVNVKINMSVYATGLCTYKINNKFQRVWNTGITLNLKKNNYTLTFNGNGGSVSPASKTIACGGIYGTLPTASRTGYSLVGWNTSASATTGNVSASTTLCNGNKTIYAIWKANTYTISYNGNGADSGSMDNTTATYNANVTLRGNAYTKKGYQFLGWSTDANATSPSYSNGQTFPWTRTGNLTLYAVWKRASFEITLHGNGNGQTKTVEIATGNPNLPVNDFKRAGYTFVGWSKEESSDHVSYKDQANVGALMDQKGTVLYAVWKKTDGSFLLDNLIHDDRMFTGDVNLTGGNGTGYDGKHIDSTYARTDQNGQQGYFTKKEY